MSRLDVAADALAELARVSLRRARHGPLHESWSFRYEVANAFLKRTMVRTARLDWPAQRRAWDALRVASPVFRRFRFEPARLGAARGEWFVPEGVGPDAPVLLYLHGGCFAFGSNDTHRELICRIALAARARTFGVEYRLAPEHPFPAALEDAVAAYRATLDAGIAPARIALAGDSAGGNLALATALAARDGGIPLPAAIALVCPWVELAARDGSVVENARYDWAEPWMFDAWQRVYLGDRDPADPRASPALANLRGLPPLLVHAGGAEMNRDQVERLAARARAAGVDTTLEVYPGMTHDWHSLAGSFPAFQGAIDAIGAFLREHLGAASTRSAGA